MNYGLKFAYELAGKQLAELDDIEGKCRKSGAQYQAAGSQRTILLKYLNRSYKITLPDINIARVDSEEEVPIRDKILILHYLLQAKGVPLTNNIIAYKELKDAANYFPIFFKRAIKPLVDYFGKEPNLLLDTAREFGGRKSDYGDTAVTIDAFSYVPVTLVLWRGDEEFAPDGNILFDSTISDYLTIDDINILCESIAWKLVRLLKESHHP